MFDHPYWEKVAKAIAHGALTREFRSCSHNALCVQAYTSDEKEPQ